MRNTLAATLFALLIQKTKQAGHPFRVQGAVRVLKVGGVHLGRVEGQALRIPGGDFRRHDRGLRRRGRWHARALAG